MNSNNNIKELIIYVKDKNRKSKNNFKSYKTLKSTIESVDAPVIFGTTTTSLTIIGVGLIKVPISAGIACCLSSANKVLHKIILNQYKKCQKKYQKYQQTIKSSDKLYKRKFTR